MGFGSGTGSNPPVSAASDVALTNVDNTPDIAINGVVLAP